MDIRDKFNTTTDSNGITDYSYKGPVASGQHRPHAVEYPAGSTHGGPNGKAFAINATGKALMFKTIDEALDYAAGE